MEDGNGASVASEVTLCSNHAYQNDAAGNLLGSRAKLAEEISRKGRKVRKVFYWRPLAAEASENL